MRAIKYIFVVGASLLLGSNLIAQNVDIYTGYTPNLKESEKMSDQPVINDTTKPAQGYARSVSSPASASSWKPPTLNTDR